MANDAAKTRQANEKIFAEFQTLRNEQRGLINNLSQVEMDLKEHKTVIDTLKTVDENRKCYRLIGGVLCAHTVKDVLPTLNDNRDQLDRLTILLKDQITKKGTEINKFREDNNIKIRGQEAFMERPDPSVANASTGSGGGGSEEGQEKKNVLVDNY